MAFIIRGMTGFGSGLLMVPVLLLFLDMKLVVPTSTILATLSGFLLIATFQTRKWVRKDVLLMMIIGGVIGTTLGTYILASIKSDLLRKLFGLFIAGYALKMLFWNKETGKEFRNYAGIIAGFFSGCLGGMFNTGGPPIIIYLSRKTKDKRIFRATMILYFLVVNTWTSATYWYAGLIKKDVIVFTSCLIPAFVIGSLTGSFLHIKINDVIFNRIVALVLLITGISLLF